MVTASFYIIICDAVRFVVKNFYKYVKSLAKTAVNYEKTVDK